MDAVFPADSVATIPPPLAEVRAKFEAWRAAKPHRNCRIPDELWSAALSLRAGMSPCAIGKALRLNPTHLAEQARRRDPRESPARTGSGAEARFVEIACPESRLVLTPETAAFLPRQILQIRFTDGTTVSAAQAAPVDVAQLFGALMSARR